MKVIEVVNLVDEEIKELEFVKRALIFAATKEKLENVEFNCIIVDNPYIHKLNKDYRGIDKETDVITFALEDEKEMIDGNDITLLGDIYISFDKAKSQAKEYGHTLKRELTFLAVHGFYHLIGFNHETEKEENIMFEKQEEVLSNYEKENV